jgi:hypothetical protein
MNYLDYLHQLQTASLDYCDQKEAARVIIERLVELAGRVARKELKKEGFGEN